MFFIYNSESNTYKLPTANATFPLQSIALYTVYKHFQIAEASMWWGRVEHADHGFDGLASKELSGNYIPFKRVCVHSTATPSIMQ